MDCVGSLSSLAESLLGGSGSGSGVRLSDDDHYQGESLDLLALGSGWTWSFLGPAAGERGLKTACTTRDGRNGSVRFLFDPESDDTAPFEALPDAKTIVVIFPLYSAEAAQRLVHGYLSTRAAHPAMHHGAYSTEKIDDKDTPVPRAAPHIILLGSTGIWNGGPTLQLGNVAGAEKACSPSKKRGPWVDRHAPVDDVPRAKGENALLAFNKGDKAETSVLCLAGLWGHGRSPRRFIARLAPTKEQLSKLTSVHFIHGHDVARALLAMHDMWDKARSERWLLTNERVYDLWDLISQWGDAGESGRAHFPQGPQLRWVQELVAESRKQQKTESDANTAISSSSPSPSKAALIRSLPRTPEQLGFAQDSTDFWNTFGLYPEVPWVD